MWKKIKQKDYAEEIKKEPKRVIKTPNPKINKDTQVKKKKKSMVMNKDTTKSHSKSYMVRKKKLEK